MPLLEPPREVSGAAEAARYRHFGDRQARRAQQFQCAVKAESQIGLADAGTQFGIAQPLELTEGDARMSR